MILRAFGYIIRITKPRSPKERMDTRGYHRELKEARNRATEVLKGEVDGRR